MQKLNRTVLLVVVTTIALSGCGRNWKRVESFSESLTCGQDLDAVKELALDGEMVFATIEGPTRFGFKAHVPNFHAGASLRFDESGLVAFELVRSTGIRTLCVYPERNLCTGEKLHGVSIRAPFELSGVRYQLDGKAMGGLRREGPTYLYLPVGSHELAVETQEGVFAETISIPEGESCIRDGVQVDFLESPTD